MGSVRDFAAASVGKHPVVSAVAMAALVVLVLFLAYRLEHYRTLCAAKSGFDNMLYSQDTFPTNDPVFARTPMDNFTPKSASAGAIASLPLCKRRWSSEAAAEAEALTACGALQSDKTVAEGRLNRAMFGNLTDRQLIDLVGK
jgi:hypothetical protein